MKHELYTFFSVPDSKRYYSRNGVRVEQNTRDQYFDMIMVSSISCRALECALLRCVLLKNHRLMANSCNIKVAHRSYSPTT